ncbi:hypothetical protein E4L96_09970 [Massilia arenosa]|uniref:Uncharacterized protein n=2 Tax=Zemynaea arenosa TaxID=2561931 RepID=A0A4Y9SGS6_9BURK|nr:hypothetical protein E4L96_09970 [Massilia arenosa]
MTWVLSDGRDSADEVRGFANHLGMNWDEVEESPIRNGGTLHLIRDIEQKSSHLGPHVFAWFEVGRNTIFLSNVVGSGAPSPLVDSAMPGYRRYLEDAHIRVEERSRLQSLLSMQTSSEEEKTVVLSYLRERLRDEAILQELADKRVRTHEAQRGWESRLFWFLVVVAVSAGLLAAAKVLPFIALPFIVVGSIGAISFLYASGWG